MVDVVVGRHIDNDCQSDTAKSKRKVSTGNTVDPVTNDLASARQKSRW